jgi:hypothetical protein
LTRTRENPYPNVQVRVSWGTGTGSPGIPQGYPCQSLNMRCCTVSGLCAQAGQIGESAFLIRCKCLARGACPVRSWVRMLVSFLGSCAVSLRKLLDGAVGSVFFILMNHGDFYHSFCASALSFSLKACIRADLLCGRRFEDILVVD